MRQDGSGKIVEKDALYGVSVMPIAQLCPLARKADWKASLAYAHRSFRVEVAFAQTTSTLASIPALYSFASDCDQASTANHWNLPVHLERFQ
jgi:hypothetical protein